MSSTDLALDKTNVPARRGRPRLKKPKTEALHARVSESEKKAFEELAKSVGMKPSTLLRRMIREASGAGPMFLQDDLSKLVTASNQVSAVGRNINQIARGINSGKVKDGLEVQEDLAILGAAIVAIKSQLKNLVAGSKSRRIRFRKGTRDG